jgi:hypothetical protein
MSVSSDSYTPSQNEEDLLPTSSPVFEEERGMTREEFEGLIEDSLTELNRPGPLCTQFSVFCAEVVRDIGMFSRYAATNQQIMDKRLNHLTEELQQKNEEHQKAIEDLQTSHEAQLCNLDAAHSARLEHELAAARDQALRKADEHQAALEQLQVDYSMRLQVCEDAASDGKRTRDADWLNRLEQLQNTLDSNRAAHEAEIANLQASHNNFITRLHDDLERHRAKANEAEQTLADFKRECRSPLLVPAMMEMLEEISHLTNAVVDDTNSEDDS